MNRFAVSLYLTGIFLLATILSVLDYIFSSTNTSLRVITFMSLSIFSIGISIYLSGEQNDR